jgi:hypothetical protein
MQVGHPALAAAAAQAATHIEGRKPLSEARDEGSEIEDAPMFAATANRYERHPGGCKLAQRAALAALVGIAVAGTHHVRRLHRTSR